MADIDILRTEIEDDPLGRSYDGMADSEVADSINAANRPGRGPVSAATVRSYILLNGIWPRLQGLAAAATDATVKGTAITILQVMAPNSFDTIRMNDPAVHAAVSAMLQTMVDAGAMTADQRAAMIALGDKMISRAEELGIPPVHHLQVAEARSIG